MSDFEREPSLAVVPAAVDGVENCVVIKDGDTPTLGAIASTAVDHSAHIDNSDDEAGDDLYAVQFPGHPQELLEQDGVSARIRELLQGDTGE